MVVREAAAGDAEALARLCTQLGYPVASEAMPARLVRLGTDPNARAFVALVPRVAGLATVHLRHTLNHEAPIAQLTLLVVDETVRGRGVGRALVRAAEQWAASRGARRINVTTALHRDDAHRFYERVGYTQTGKRYGRDFPVA